MVQRVKQEIEASNKTSPTAPGPTNSADASERTNTELIDAINQVFALFRINYHNQFYAAFSEAEQLNQIKKLWLESLGEFPPAQILQGAKQAIENNEYLPTLKAMRSCCADALPALGFPAPENAYLEACNGAQERENSCWSHETVYWAARDTGWMLLASGTQSESHRSFTAHYLNRCKQHLSGDPLPDVPKNAENRVTAKPLNRDQAQIEITRILDSLKDC
ncbi:MAG: replication protein P [Pseudomonadota bacterium]